MIALDYEIYKPVKTKSRYLLRLPVFSIKHFIWQGQDTKKEQCPSAKITTRMPELSLIYISQLKVHIIRHINVY